MIAIITIVVLTLVVTGSIYNRLINLKNLVENSWSNVDTELKRRHELIPNLVSTVKGYAKHEKEVLEKVILARKQAMKGGGLALRMLGENHLVGAVQGLMGLREKYPRLKADKVFLKLQRELVNTEDRIQASRRFFNANVREYNTAIQGFPTVLISSLFGFKKTDFFQTNDVELVDVKF